MLANTQILLTVCTIGVLTADAYKITDEFGVGRRFDGIGGLSGGGATSKLLVSYPEPQRSQILDLLFKQQHGAALQILKVEIGGDGQSTDGSESSHMHESWDESYHRGYEWWLMKEAKKRNPDILLSALSWAFPGWVGDYGSDPYKNVSKLAYYTVSWIKGAKEVHNLTIDFIGIWNERMWNNDYILELRSSLDRNGFRNTKIVAPDTFGMEYSGFEKLFENATLRNALYAIGVHYPGTELPRNMRSNGVPLWSSEDYSTFNDDVGAGCWARILNQNYVNGNMTSTISWNLIASYYSALPYERDGLMTAMHPWSGHYTIDNPIWVTAHTTHFASVGWNYLKHGKGSGKLGAGGSFVSLTNGKDLTIVIETLSHNHSICIRPSLPAYNVAEQSATFVFSGSFSAIKKLQLYTTRFFFDGRSTVPFEKQADAIITDSKLTLRLAVDAVYTLSTIVSPGRVEPKDIPAASDFPLPYSENFDSYAADEEPHYLAQQNGAWEVVKSEGESFVRQKVLNHEIAWCGQSFASTAAVIGDAKWRDVSISIRVRVPSSKGANTLFAALRSSSYGCGEDTSTGLFLWLNPNTTTYWISYDIASLHIAYIGLLPTPFQLDQWHTASLSVVGSTFSIGIDSHSISVALGKGAASHGFVAFGSQGYGYSDWDDLRVESGVDDVFFK
uniref:galactosylceramidase n=2 Tax=Plectus sambesii TaxID=2011161 RepID=A0A914X953_9BILA